MKKSALVPGLIFLLSCSPAPEERPSVVKSGQLAPALELTQLVNCENKEISGWKDLRGKAVVLNFWATWCEPSVEELERLDGLTKKFHDKPVVFISVTDESRSAVSAFIKTHDVQGCVAAEAPASVFQAFRVYGRPHTILADRASRVAASPYPGQVAEETIAALIEGRALSEPQPGTAAVRPLAEFFIAGTAAKKGPAVHGRAFVSAEGAALFDPLEIIFKADKIEPDKEARELLAAHYDLRASLPPEKSGEYEEFFSRGLEAALGLKLAPVRKKAGVYILKRSAGAVKGFEKKPAGPEGSSSQAGSLFIVNGLGLDALCLALKARLGTPVINEAGLSGSYSYSFNFKDGAYETIAAELPAQLGLRLEKGVRKVNVLEVRALAPR